MSAALAAAMLASAIALPAFADGTNIMQYYYDKTDSAYKTQTNTEEAQNANESDENLTTSGTTEVKYEVHSSYSWSIPSEIDFGSDRGAGQRVFVNTIGWWPQEPNISGSENKASVVAIKQNVIPMGKKLVIRAEGSGDSDDNGKQKFTMKNTQGSDELDYEVYVENSSTALVSGGEVLYLSAGENINHAELTFVMQTVGGAEYAGEYKGTVTFTATVEDDN